MDKDTVDLMTRLNSDQNEQFERLLKSKEDNDSLRFKGMQQSMSAGFDTLASEMKQLNGSIKDNMNDIRTLENQTTWWRFFQRNPKKTVITLIMISVGMFVIIGFDVDGKEIMEFIKSIKFW